MVVSNISSFVKDKKSDFAFSMSSAAHPNKQKSVPIIFSFSGGKISACKVMISSKPTFDAVFNVISPYFYLIFTFILCLYNVAKASFKPTPNLPMSLSLFNFSSFSFCVK